jgi:O-acetyl-ADP-ribose deacetylase (regulator of RNase III)
LADARCTSRVEATTGHATEPRVAVGRERDTYIVPFLTAVHGDITEQRVDAIVNAANNAVRGGGGVNGAIHRAGGPTILRECTDRFPQGLATGDAGWTKAGGLPAQWVIHTVGPNYTAGQQDPLQLISCYRRALHVADGLGAQSIAFPIIGVGSYGWPLYDGIQLAVRTIATARSDVLSASLVTNDKRTYEELQNAIRLHYQLSGPLGDSTATEWARFRHDWDPAPDTDSARLIIRDRMDGEPGVVVILAETDVDYRTYHLGPNEIAFAIDALTRAGRRPDGS